MPRMDRSNLCISSLKDIILITLPDSAFPILKVTQSPEFNSPIKRCKQSVKQFRGEKRREKRKKERKINNNPAHLAIRPIEIKIIVFFL